MAEQASLTVDGVLYELPPLDTITIGESKIIKRHSGMTIDQLFELDGLDGGAIGGLLAVAMKRADPTLSDRDLDRQVDEIVMFNVMEELAERLVEAPDPTLAEALSPEPDSNESNSEPTESSGNSGKDASALSPEKSNPASTGQPDSETAVASGRPTWAP